MLATSFQWIIYSWLIIKFLHSNIFWLRGWSHKVTHRVIMVTFSRQKSWKALKNNCTCCGIMSALLLSWKQCRLAWNSLLVFEQMLQTTKFLKKKKLLQQCLMLFEASISPGSISHCGTFSTSWHVEAKVVWIWFFNIAKEWEGCVYC